YLSAELLLARSACGMPDCLLLDIDLDGMSGLQLLQHLREQGKRIPIIFVTGRDDETARHSARTLGCSDFLRKPVSSQVLVAAIHAAISTPASPSH
ncbi:MAG: response regulator transcription factor, partial [Massilia sp.]